MDRFGTGRERFKRSYTSTMPTAPDTDDSDSLFVSPDRNTSRSARDYHYNNEQDTSRRRLHLPTPPVRRWPGDGVDHRRPIMSHGGGAAGPTGGTTRSGALSEIIDLTEGDAEEAAPPPPPRQSTFEDMMQEEEEEQVPAAEDTSRAQRPPRFGRDIIAIDDDSDGEARRTNPTRAILRENGLPPRPQFAGLRRPGHVRQPSPPLADTEDFLITGERTASRAQTLSRQPTPAMVQPRQSFTPLPGQAAVDLTQDDDDDVIHVNTTVREGGGTNAGAPIQFGGYRGAAPDLVNRHRRTFGFGGIADLLNPGHLHNHLMRRMGVGSAATEHEEMEERALHEAAMRGAREQGHRHRHHHHHHHAHGVAHHHHHHRQGTHGTGLADAANHFGLTLGARQPVRRNAATHLMGMGVGMGIGMMDYDEVAFDLGMGGNRPASPEYKAPEEAKEGFTRSPREEDEIVCPNCGDELAVGDGDLKQQVWVVKSCGHAYCGECAEKRTASKTSKGKGKARATEKPMKKCVVDGCGKGLTGKGGMIHVYMSS